MTTTVVILLSVGACSTVPPHRSQAISLEHPALSDVSLVSVVPSDELSVRREFAIEGQTGAPAFVVALCPVCLIPMLVVGSADKENQEKSLAQEDATLLPTLLDQLGDKRTRVLWSDALRNTVQSAKDMTFSRVDVVVNRAPYPEDASSLQVGRGKPFALLELDHHLSSDLDKLRIKVRARLYDGKGTLLADQYYFYLPPRVPGFPKSEAIKIWAANSGEHYINTTSVGITGLLDALDLTLFSYKSRSITSLGDASTLLTQRHCFSADYEAGIPLDAYKKGMLLALRRDYSVVQLENSDILVIPTCNQSKQ